MFSNRTSKVFITLLALAVALSTASFIARSASVPSSDTSYNSVEQVRSFGSVPSDADLHGYDAIENLRLFRDPKYTEYDQIERIRLQGRLGLIKPDQSYDLVERIRIERGLTADRSYDSIEAIRLQR